MWMTMKKLTLGRTLAVGMWLYSLASVPGGGGNYNRRLGGAHGASYVPVLLMMSYGMMRRACGKSLGEGHGSRDWPWGRRRFDVWVRYYYLYW